MNEFDKNRKDDNFNDDNDKGYDIDRFSSEKTKPIDTPSDIELDTSVEDEFDLDLIFGDGDISFDLLPMGSAQNQDDNEETININNFGKPKQEDKKKFNFKISKKTAKSLKIVGTAFVTVLLIGIITGCLVAGAFAIYVFNFVDDTIDQNLYDLKFTTTVYVLDNDSGEYVEYQRLHGEENRIWVDLEDMPADLKNAYIAVEDKRFNEHNGVDWKRTVSAFANMFLDLYSSNQGGSTITQQLVKNVTKDSDQTPMRKVREIMRARRLESEYEKETILECYLNTICLAGGIYGVEVAANYYFGKSVSELNLVECAAIASLAKEPEKYRPDRNPNDNKKRRNTVLYLMYEQGYISETEYNEAKNAELNVVSNPIAKNPEKINSYFIDALYEEVTQKLVERYGYDEAHASLKFYNGGYKIYCTLDPEIQAVLDDEYSKTNIYFKLKRKDKTIQSAMTIMDYEGHIVGIVGGAGEKTESRGFNRATMAYRQPGSSIKPLAAYSQSLQKNLITYSTVLEDSPIEQYTWDSKTSQYKPGPTNSYDEYLGNMFAYKALERSTNTIACKLVGQLGFDSVYSFLYDRFKLTDLNYNSDRGYSALGIGGTSTGITTTQSAAAYAVFGNLGKYYEPTTFTLVTDQRGNVILEQEDGETLIDENTASIMNHMMQNVVYGSNGTAKTISDFSDTMKCFAKTGTTNDYYDIWLSGGTPYYVASCWFGFDTPGKIASGYRNLSKDMWENVMRRIHKNLEPKEFKESEFVTRRYFCKETGLLATTGCNDYEIGYYKTNYSLPKSCTEHEGKTYGEVTDEWIENGGPILEEPEEPQTPDSPNTPETPTTPPDETEEN